MLANNAIIVYVTNKNLDSSLVFLSLFKVPPKCFNPIVPMFLDDTHLIIIDSACMRPYTLRCSW